MEINGFNSDTTNKKLINLEKEMKNSKKNQKNEMELKLNLST